MALAPRAERGSQAVEFALVLPVVLLAALVLVQVAVLGGESVAAQALAAQAARAAAIDGPAAARAVTERAGHSGAQVRVRRVAASADPAAWYVVELRLRSRAFRPFGTRFVSGRGAARAQ